MAKSCKINTKCNSKEKKVSKEITEKEPMKMGSIKPVAAKSTKKITLTQKPKNDNGKIKLKRIIFSYFDPEAHQVSLAGDFNNWEQGTHLLKRKDSGEWNLALNLKPGSYDYRYLVDGEWRDDPKCIERVPNPFGTLNNRIVIK